MAKRKREAEKRALPSPLLPKQAVDGADEPMVRSAPPIGRSGDVKVHKAVHDLLCADPGALGPHVFRLTAKFVQGASGRRSVSLRLDLDEDFPHLPLATLPEKLEVLQHAGEARCAAVLGADFHVLSVYFGGKKLR